MEDPDRHRRARALLLRHPAQRAVRGRGLHRAAEDLRRAARGSAVKTAAARRARNPGCQHPARSRQPTAEHPLSRDGALPAHSHAEHDHGAPWRTPTLNILILNLLPCVLVHRRRRRAPAPYASSSTARPLWRRRPFAVCVCVCRLPRPRPSRCTVHVQQYSAPPTATAAATASKSINSLGSC
jgi:hypothetical protein